MLATVHPIEDQSGSDAAAETWQPLLDGVLRERAIDTVQAIASYLRYENSISTEAYVTFDSSLGSGAAGLAVLFAYLAKARSGAEEEATAKRYLDQAIRSVSEVEAPASLYAGLTGVAWAAAHLQRFFPDLDSQSIAAEIDEVLLEHLSHSPWPGSYDLIDGLVGFGVYALERGPHIPIARTCLERVIELLDEMAEHRPEGIAWETRSEWLQAEVRDKRPPRYYDLGLAHGIPGIIGLLGRVCEADVAVDRARPLLNGAARWLMVRRAMVGNDGFPYHLEPGLPCVPARLAWCYGDAGVAAALLLAARCAKEPAWERAARSVVRRAAERPPEEAEVVDAGLCHGAAGLGHLFNRMFQTTGEPRLKEAAKYWFQRTLEMRRPGRGIAGFAAWGGGSKGSPNWINDPGFLNGAAGIALALLAAVTPIEPAWDRVLIVSIPPLPGALRRTH